MKNVSIRIILCAAVLAVVGLNGCSNTWRGVGQDTEHAGQKIQNSAE